VIRGMSEKGGGAHPGERSPEIENAVEGGHDRRNRLSWSGC